MPLELPTHEYSHDPSHWIWTALCTQSEARLLIRAMCDALGEWEHGVAPGLTLACMFALPIYGIPSGPMMTSFSGVLMSPSMSPVVAAHYFIFLFIWSLQCLIGPPAKRRPSRRWQVCHGRHPSGIHMTYGLLYDVPERAKLALDNSCFYASTLLLSVHLRISV